MSNIIQSDQDDYPRIWLSPICDETGDEGRRWSDLPLGCGCECDKGSHTWVEFVRANTLNSLASEADLRAKLDVAVEALRAVRSKGRSPGIGVTRDIANTALATIGGTNEQG